MKIIKVFEGEWTHWGSGMFSGMVCSRTVGGNLSPRLFSTADKALKAAQEAERSDFAGRKGSAQAEKKIAVKLPDGRIFPVAKCDKFDLAEMKKRRIPAWNGEGDPSKGSNRAIVKVDDTYHFLLSRRAVPLDSK